MKERILTAEDVMKIPASALPLIVFSDNIRSFFSWGIKAHQKGNYNHVMFMASPKWLLSQDLLFHQVEIEKYLAGGHRLKFVGNRLWSNRTNRKLRDMARAAARQPWYKRRYDCLGILGQLIGCDSLNVPWLNYCSERVASFVREADPLMVMKHPSPTDLNWYMKDQSRRGYYVYGRYFPD